MTELDDLDLDDLDLDDELDTKETTKEESSEIEDDNLEIDDLDLDEGIETNAPVVDEDAEALKAASESRQNKDENLDDLDIDLDDEPEEPEAVPEAKTPEVKAPEVKAPEVKPEEPAAPKAEKTTKKAPKSPKAEKAPKKTKEKESPVVENKSSMTIRFDPAFDISPANLDTKTFQIRKTRRDAADIEDLKNRIETQGQVEAIQIVIKDGKNYLIAGEGRVMALRQLDRPAKALVYEGLTEEEILKISFGSNEGRLEMSEWDRTISIGEYFDKDPLVSKDDTSDPNSLISVFGLNKSSIYSYLKMWGFYKNIPAFHDFYSKFRCPLYVLSGVVEVLIDYAEKIDSYDAVIDILKRIVTRNDLSRKTFTNVLLKEITDFLLQVKMSKNEIPVDETPLDDVELAKSERQTRQDLNKKLKLTEAEQIKKRIENNKTNKDIAEKAEKLIHDLDKSLKSAIILLEELGELEGFHKLVPSETINAAVKKVSKLNQLVTILV